MLKKTLIAAAVASIVTAPAMALTLNVKTSGGSDFTANTLAVQTKQDVLDKTSLDAKLSATFNNTAAGVDEDELKSASELIIQLSGQGQFNADKIADLLSTVGDPADATTPASFPGLSISVSTSAGIVGTQVFSTVTELAKLFKIDQTGTGAGTLSSIRYTLDPTNQSVALRLNDSLTGTIEVSPAVAAVAAVPEVVADPTATPPVVGSPAVPAVAAVAAVTIPLDAASITVNFDFNQDPMKQGFKLVSGVKSTVAMSVGALQNASYTANPVTTPTLFKTEDLFTLKQTDLAAGSADATALVADTYRQWNQGASASIRGVKLVNNSTLQNIQTGELKLTLTGNFDGIRQASGTLSNTSGTATNWTIAGNTASTLYSKLTTAATIPGTNNSATYTGFDLTLPAFVVDAANTTSLEAQKFALTAEIVNGSFTYVPYSQTIGNAFVVVRDGMKFDTVTTGTTSSNVIYIRDVSKTLPADGGKIFVTITEYDAHGADANGAGTDLITRAVLPTRLPSNGAVTLTPAGIANALGVALNPARQARFFFEVETNQGEAAVKKATSDGVDIQTGRSQSVTDFTL